MDSGFTRNGWIQVSVAEWPFMDTSSQDVKGFRPGFTSLINPKKVKELEIDFLNNMTSEQVFCWDITFIQALTAKQVSALNETTFSFFKDSQIRALTIEQMRSVRAEQMNALTPKQRGYFRKNQVQALDPSQLLSLDSETTTALYDQFSVRQLFKLSLEQTRQVLNTLGASTLAQSLAQKTRKFLDLLP